MLQSLKIVPGESDRVLALAIDDVLKGHIRVDGTHDDALLESYATAAVEWYEDAAARSLITATWEARFDCFPGQVGDERRGPRWERAADRYAIFLPKSPAVAVTSVKYLDGDHVERTIDAADYALDAEAEPATIVPALGKTWPAVASDRPGAVRVRFTAGYGTTADEVPHKIQQCLRLLVAHWYDPARGPVVTGTIVAELPFALRSLFWSTRAQRAA